jgi:hypothetical protein
VERKLKGRNPGPGRGAKAALILGVSAGFWLTGCQSHSYSPLVASADTISATTIIKTFKPWLMDPPETESIKHPVVTSGFLSRDNSGPHLMLDGIRSRTFKHESDCIDVLIEDNYYVNHPSPSGHYKIVGDVYVLPNDWRRTEEVIYRDGDSVVLSCGPSYLVASSLVPMNSGPPLVVDTDTPWTDIEDSDGDLAEMKALDRLPCQSVSDLAKMMSADPITPKGKPWPVKLCGVLNYGYRDKNLYQDRAAVHQPDPGRCIQALTKTKDQERARQLSGKAVELTGWMAHDVCKDVSPTGRGDICPVNCSPTGVIIHAIKVR